MPKRFLKKRSKTRWVRQNAAKFFDREWFSGGMYKKGQPTETFLRSALRDPRWAVEIRALLLAALPDHRHPEKSVALEIGPGITPLLSLIPGLKTSVFLEQSHALAKGLEEIPITAQKPGGRGIEQVKLSDWLGSQMLRVTGDVRRLPFNSNTRFDVIAMGEVLTHVKPRNRLSVVRDLAKHANALFIIDRDQPPYAEYKNGVRNRDGSMPSDWQVRQRHQLLVDFKPVFGFLKKSGWELLAKKIPWTDGHDYIVLLAKRPA